MFSQYWYFETVLNYLKHILSQLLLATVLYPSAEQVDLIIYLKADYRVELLCRGKCASTEDVRLCLDKSLWEGKYVKYNSIIQFI